MRRFGKTIRIAGLAGLVWLGAAAVTVSDVTARQRYPWNDLVDIDYTITGSDAEGLDLSVKVTDGDTDFHRAAVRCD